jgi:hypothetical protein
MRHVSRWPERSVDGPCLFWEYDRRILSMSEAIFWLKNYINEHAPSPGSRVRQRALEHFQR